MKFLSLPRSRPGAGPAGTPPTRLGLKLLLTGLGSLLACFTLGLFLFFPTAPLKERLLQQFATHNQGELQMDDLALDFPPGLRATNLSLQLEVPGLPPLVADTVTISPLWHTLLSTRPGVHLHATFQGGTLEAQGRRQGPVEFEARQIPLAIPLPDFPAIQILGRLEEGHGTGGFPLSADTETSLNLQLDQVQIAGLDAFGVPGGRLALGTLVCTGSGQGKSFKVERLTAQGGDLEVSGEGTILFADVAERSRLNLNLSLQPRPGLDPGLTDLLGLFAKAGRDGTFRLRVSGTLARPIVR